MASDSDQRLYDFLEKYLEHSVADLPPNEVLAARYQFSPGFDVRMALLFRKARKAQDRCEAQSYSPRSSKLRKRLILVAIILAILAALAIVTFAVKPEWNFLMWEEDGRFHFLFNLPQPTDGQTSWEPFTEADLNIPEGFAIKEKYDAYDFYVINYEKADKTRFQFKKMMAAGLGSSLADGDGIIIEHVTIRDQDAISWQWPKENMSILMWQEDIWVYQIEGDMPLEDLWKVLPSSWYEK